MTISSACSRSLLESRIALRIKHPYEEQTRVYLINCEGKNAIGGRRWNIATEERKICDTKIEILRFCIGLKRNYSMFLSLSFYLTMNTTCILSTFDKCGKSEMYTCWFSPFQEHKLEELRAVGYDFPIYSVILFIPSFSITCPTVNYICFPKHVLHFRLSWISSQDKCMEHQIDIIVI